MDSTEKQALNNCWLFFKENVSDVYDILDDFIQAGVNPDDVEDITAQPTSSRRKRAFLRTVQTWGSGAFCVLLEALNRTGYKHVTERLKDELENAKQTKTCFCAGSTLPPWLSTQVGKMKVSENALHILAQELAPSVFFLLGSCLGLSHARLQQLQANDSHTVSLQFSSMLCEWRSTQSSEATVESLVLALLKANVDEELFRDILLDDTGVLKGQNLGRIHLMESLASSVSSREQWV